MVSVAVEGVLRAAKCGKLEAEGRQAQRRLQENEGYLKRALDQCLKSSMEVCWGTRKENRIAL